LTITESGRRILSSTPPKAHKLSKIQIPRNPRSDAANERGQAKHALSAAICLTVKVGAVSMRTGRRTMTILCPTRTLGLSFREGESPLKHQMNWCNEIALNAVNPIAHFGPTKLKLHGPPDKRNADVRMAVARRQRQSLGRLTRQQKGAGRYSTPPHPLKRDPITP